MYVCIHTQTGTQPSCPFSPLSFLPPASDGNYRSDMQIATVTANAWLTVTLLTDRYTMSTRRRCTASVIIRARVYFTLVTPNPLPRSAPLSRFVPWNSDLFGRRVEKKKRERKTKEMESIIFNTCRGCRKRDIFRESGWSERPVQ